MKILITKLDDGYWHLQLSDEMGTKYGSLLKLAKALMKWAKGQNL